MRHKKIVRIETEGRDKGKYFQLEEMPADQGEKWAYRALLALSRGGMRLPPGIFDHGMAGLASIVPYLVIVGLQSLHSAKWEELEPLLDEMLTCVKYQPPQAGAPLQELLPGVLAQTEEIRTRAELRKMVLEMHVDPSLAAVLQNSDQPDEQPASSAATSNA